MLKISVICENAVSKNFNQKTFAEWGLSIFIETGTQKILFDTGKSGIFAQNAKIMGLELDETDFIILSHEHWDHVNGLLNYLGYPEIF